MSRQFTCASCKETFNSGWTEAEAEAEYINNFPTDSERGIARYLVCDDCYEEMIAWKSPKQAERELTTDPQNLIPKETNNNDLEGE